jgi:hypoxanthine phosphoribosyltransferase
MRKGIDRVLISREQIQEKVAQMGAQITEDFKGEEVIVACVLKGAFMFCADLVRHLDLPLTLEFLEASSYGYSSRTSGNVQIRRDFDVDIGNKNVLLVEDIVDTGLTLLRLREMLMVRKPKSLRICTLLDKPERRKVEMQPDYLGFTIPDEFVVGYGLDYAGHYRSLKDICVLDASVYTKC